MTLPQFLRDRIFWAVLGLCTLMLALVAVEPFGADNAVLHSMALDFVKQGKVPYIGSWDNNFPGVVYVHALAILVFGPSDFGYRLLDICIQLFFAGFLYRFLLRWMKTHTAALASVLYVAYYVAAGPDVFGKQDDFGMMAIVVGASFVIARTNAESRGWAAIILGGVIAGVSLLMRPTFLLHIGFITLFVTLGSNRRLSATSLLQSVVFFIACFTSVGCVLLYYNTIPAGLAEVYNSTIRFNLDVYASLGTNSKFWWELLRTGLVIPLALYAITRTKGSLSSLVRSPDVREKLLYASLVLSSLTVVIIMGKFYRYHLAAFFLMVMPMTAVGLEKLALHVRSDVRRHFVFLGGVFLCSFIAYNPISPLAFMLGLLTKVDPSENADIARRPDTLFGAIPEGAILTYLNKPENRTGAVEVCSYSPFLRYRLHRLSAGPYITFHAISFRTDATRIGPPHYTSYQRKWQRDYMNSLVSVKPHFIVLARRMSFWYIQDVYDDCLHYLPGFDSLLAASYRYDTTIAGWQTYRRIN